MHWQRFPYFNTNTITNLRWMSKCIYIIKMCLLQHQIPKLHWMTKKKITKMALFVVFCHLRPWFEASSIPAAASNDLQLYKSLEKYKKVDKAVGAKTCTVLNRHTWYMTEDLISLSLFHEDLPLQQRTNLAAKIHETAAPGDLEIRKPTLPTISKDSQLLDFAGGRSRLLFDLLDISTDFLQHDDWHLSDDYKTCKTALRSLSATNDSAERAIALATRFNTTITRDEASHQELLQVVEHHSLLYKCNTKDNLKKFM